VIHDFLQWMLDHGESEAADMTYAPLPKSVVDKLRGALNYIH
jgi:phosphate transport system substrate-binding protein